MKRLVALMIVIVPLFVWSCGNPTSPSFTNNIPADHTVNRGGALHKPGYTNPTSNCVDCHGSDLRGGTGPSCYSCHGKKW